MAIYLGLIVFFKKENLDIFFHKLPNLPLILQNISGSRSISC